MSNESESISKQPSRQRSKVFSWVLLFCVAFLVFLLIALNWGPARPVSEHLAVAAVVTVFVAVVGWFVRWLCCWRHFRWALLGLACLVTLFALAYAVENWRGERAWEAYRQKLEAQGENLDPLSLVPPPVPDAENFAMTPLWKVQFDYEQETGASALSVSVPPPHHDGDPSRGDWPRAERVDLAAWQAFYRGKSDVLDTNTGTPFFPTTAQPQSPAKDVLLALSHYDDHLEELRQAAKRPHSRFPIRYEEGFNALLPHLALMKRASQFLTLRAAANLAEGNTEEALADVLLGFRCVEAIQTEPLLISQLLRIAMMNILLQPIWEGLVDQRWSDAQLMQMEHALARLDFLQDYGLVIRGERNLSIAATDQIRRNRLMLSSFMVRGWPDPGDGSLEGEASGRWIERTVYGLVPSGWLYQNMVTLARMHHELLLPATDPSAHRVFLNVATDIGEQMESRLGRVLPYNFVARLLLPALGKVMQKHARIQSHVDLARVVCALERYRLAHGNYPEGLNELSPRFIEKLPPDIFNGEPLNYQRTEDGRFLLYSVGWNGTDEGGEVVWSKTGKDVGFREGDWVWPSSARQN